MREMFSRLRKGTNSGMPIIAVVAVIGSLAGMGVIFQVIGGVGTETGQDHDRRELNDIGSAIENKCTDVAGNSDTSSVTSIDVSVDLKTDSELGSASGESGEGEYISELELSFSDSTETYDLPSDSCDIEWMNDTLGTGQYQFTVSQDGYSDSDNDVPIIRVEAN
ncbi:hypothetical protein AQV86_05760 [Nanohaloarchaea archaeon SG9]|nr:hypothetical protein AQV86_05760 [Nanohaloarchaea archaeon SG9]